MDVLPGRGCEIAQITHRASGHGVLLELPPDGPDRYGSSLSEWISAYRGGWQVLIPNAGLACRMGEQDWGYHGEASTRSWDLEQSTGSSLVASTTLETAPLHLDRFVRVEGESVTMTDRVRNLADQPIDFIWGQHPAFGGAILDGPAYLTTNAQGVVVDDLASRTLHQPATWPFDDGVDLRQVPAPADRTMFYLTGFPTIAWVNLHNPAVGLGVELTWRTVEFPCAWIWQEFGAAQDFPFLGRVRTCAIEPMSSYPGRGAAITKESGGNLVTLAAGQSLTRGITLRVRDSSR